MFKTNFLIFFAASLFFFSCNRSVSTDSNVTLSFPNLNKVGSMTCTTCLKYIIVKVEGDGFDKIVTKVSAENIRDTTEVSGEFTYNIPTGMNRKFKAFAVYIFNGTHILASGESSVDLPDTTAKEVSINMTSLGEIHGGSLVGRYITGTSNGSEYGPTGTVDVILNASTDTDFDMLIQQVPILNGWFELMASENLNMTYKIPSQNITLFSNTSLNSLVPINGATSTNHVARLVRPQTYYRNNGSGTWELNDEKHDIIYGFFGAAAYLTNKYVCFEYVSGPSSFSNVSNTASNAALLTYSHTSVAANFYGISGMNSNQTPCIGSTAFDRFTSTHISINKNQLDGKGNDTAKGFGNAFTYSVSSGDVTKAVYTGGLFRLKTLPGLFSSITGEDKFQDIQLFSKPNAAHGGFDELQCNNEWLSANGFSSLAATTALISSGDYTTFAVTGTISSSDGTVACPTKNNQLTNSGGFYLGGLYFGKIISTPNVTISSAVQSSIVVTNTGTAPVYNLTATMTSSPSMSDVIFSGGTYPGSGGDCGSFLASGASCTIKIYSPTVGATGTINLNYDNGGQFTIQINVVN